MKLNRLKMIAIFFLGIHGLMEVAGMAMVFAGGSHSAIFYLDWLNKNPVVTALFGLCAGIIRLVAVAGLLKNRKWAAMLAIYISLVTFAALTFYLPYGAIDAVLVTPPLIIMVMLVYGKEELPV